MKYIKAKIDVAEKRKNENMEAVIEQQSAVIDYIAIMSDIEIPTENETEGGEK